MPFLSDVVIRNLLDGRFRLEREVIYRGRWGEIVVPSGFVTDFASVPRLLQWIAPKLGRHDRAALLHDYLYKMRPVIVGSDGVRRRVSRADADGIFRRAMREEGVGRFRRWSFYWGVRAGGWVAWRRARRAIP